MLETLQLIEIIGAEIVEMIGGVRDTHSAGALPVLIEARIDAILALGRLDEREGDAGTLNCLPVDIALPLRDVDAVDRLQLRML